MAMNETNAGGVRRRPHRGSAGVGGPKREFVPRSRNPLLEAGPGALVPHIEDTAWFFDTELLALAQPDGLRVHEVPVDRVDEPDSTTVPQNVTALPAGAATAVESMEYAS